MFEPFEKSILFALLDGEISILVAFATKIVLVSWFAFRVTLATAAVAQ